MSNLGGLNSGDSWKGTQAPDYIKNIWARATDPATYGFTPAAFRGLSNTKLKKELDATFNFMMEKAKAGENTDREEAYIKAITQYLRNKGATGV